ncbi:M48 family metallopeptidase [Chenggangzhangella methanolivorans]|uniref:M48 family metallopeptidase n=1 Tax=Chenggangzhangella methanolivorans TaxID=1437009 RepID=A0A9E6RAH1_9HYPH|nr:M48 family metallopeptidase [Chenggangzhangella methanolivorans]QZO00255.1 M48 family metallopeptidase [Chenggangzhangella methanolivorans]
MTSSGTGVFFDGLTSRRQDVHVALQDATLEILRPDGARLDMWPLGQLRELSAPPELLRLGHDGGNALARLEIRDRALAAQIRASAPRLTAALAEERGTTRKVVLWSLAAMVSVSLFTFYGVPALADRVAPLLPWSVDRHMGDIADRQIRAVFPTDPGGFECGASSEERPGREALDRLTKRLSDAAALPVPIKVTVVRSDFVNALALPGGGVYLFRGLLDNARSADEIAGVLAHEIGHVAHRDGARRALQAGGASLLFGFILGDVVGGTAAITIARVLSEAHYSRAAETNADDYAADLMKKIGADPRPLGEFLSRLTEGASEPEADQDKAGKTDDAGEKPTETEKRKERSLQSWISSHPESEERRRRVDAVAGDGPFSPVVDGADFLAIQRICGKPS